MLVQLSGSTLQRVMVSSAAMVERTCSSTSARSSPMVTVNWRPSRRWSFLLKTAPRVCKPPMWCPSRKTRPAGYSFANQTELPRGSSVFCYNSFAMTTLTFNSHRSPVHGRGGIVSTSQPLATAAGLETLAKGGNAADAAVAAGAALNVTEPTSTGIGGDMFALFYSADTARVTALNGSGRAPASLTLDRLKKEGFSSALPPFHAHTVTVPGACAGWFDLIEKHGSLSMAEILAPAIRLAEVGFPVAPITAKSWQRGAERQLKSALNGHELTIDGRGPNVGEIFRNPGLARTFKTVAEGGKSAYYHGAIAEAIVSVIQESGGCMSAEDIASHVSTWEEPISVDYRGYRVYECPPNGQGITALIGLNILEGFDLAALEALSIEKMHLMIEAMRLA